MTQVFGFALAGMAGLSLGLLGGGGSLLTVPILVYGFHQTTVAGSSYSLFVVGVTALIGAASAWRKGLVHLPMAALFLSASFPMAFVTRKYLLHSLPETLGLGGGWSFPREAFLMGTFGMLMMAAAALTSLQPESLPGDPPARRPGLPVLLLIGAGVGAMTGLFGAGGGFLIVPALILAAHLPMRTAIGTSMAIVSGNSWIGLAGDFRSDLVWDWPFLLAFTALALAGMLLGRTLGGRLQPSALRAASAATLMAVGLFIFIKEISGGLPWS